MARICWSLSPQLLVLANHISFQEKTDASYPGNLTAHSLSLPLESKACGFSVSVPTPMTTAQGCIFSEKEGLIFLRPIPPLDRVQSCACWWMEGSECFASCAESEPTADMAQEDQFILLYERYNPKSPSHWRRVVICFDGLPRPGAFVASPRSDIPQLAFYIKRVPS